MKRPVPIDHYMGGSRTHRLLRGLRDWDGDSDYKLDRVRQCKPSLFSVAAKYESEVPPDNTRARKIAWEKKPSSPPQKSTSTEQKLRRKASQLRREEEERRIRQKALAHLLGKTPEDTGRTRAEWKVEPVAVAPQPARPAPLAFQGWDDMDVAERAKRLERWVLPAKAQQWANMTKDKAMACAASLGILSAMSSEWK